MENHTRGEYLNNPTALEKKEAMEYDFIIFGGTGLQGRICARDLLESGYSVLLAGRNPEGIKSLLNNKKAGFLKIDLTNQRAIIKAIKNSSARIVINCAELIFNIPIMKACLACKKSCTDLGGLQKVTEQQFKLHQKFKETGILCITGCGSTPGILNVMAAHVLEELDTVEEISLGFAWDSNIKQFVIPYSLQSIFEEFNQPPATYHQGRFIKESRIRCKGTMNFRSVGTQTVYCIVHSEVYSFPRYFKKKGLKTVHYMAGFPEHSRTVLDTLMNLGFSSEKTLAISGKQIRPVDFTTALLKRLPIPQGYKETEDLWVRMSGTKNKKKVNKAIDCVVKTTPGWEDAGSNVDTGRTIAIMSSMLYSGIIKETGVHAPEGVIPHRAFIKELGKRGMHVYVDGKKIT
ncbi:saccharopine dehydrogenase NADP-binding domain-containing protein [Candidatus Pacearchaeota archaeon]|nr:saccharopine dehydrogenase NADP-binding domain-containing protein [Candidatus Pacearchaeota archaeon]